MHTRYLAAQGSASLTKAQILTALNEAYADEIASCRRILIIAPDFTRLHSNAGLIVNALYHALYASDADILVALGTHAPMTRGECAEMYGDIPFERFKMHDWRSDVVRLGEVSADFVRDASDGLVSSAVAVEVNRALLDGYDRIISVGQVVPHEVVGMANHTKNIFVGCGGSDMINASHMLGAFYGMERIMGKDKTPVRRVFDEAMRLYLSELPISYALTVTTAPRGEILTHGLYIGEGRECFEKAVAQARKTNMTSVDRPFTRAVVYLDEREFKSTWLGNKAIYRTRMAMADGGELIVLAPGVERFGEDAEVDRLIRRYGYCGRERVIALCGAEPELRQNLSAAAHLIHGSADGRFKVTYCTRRLTKAEVEGVGYGYMPYDEAIRRYDPSALRNGEQTLADGESVYYISNPALGLWAYNG